MDNAILNTEFIYNSIPLVWYRTYHKILELLVCYGERKVINPNCKCAGNNDIVTQCYDLFQSAVAAYHLDNKVKGQEIVNYIEYLLRGFESSDTFVVTLNGITYLFTKDDIIVTSKEEEQIPVVVTYPVYYGVITPTSLVDWDKPQKFVDAQITNFVISTLTTSGTLPVVFNQTIDITKGTQMLIVLVPESSNNIVKKDTGFGGKTTFEGSLWYSNGDTSVIIDDVKYKVYGQMYTTFGDVTIYIS